MRKWINTVVVLVAVALSSCAFGQNMRTGLLSPPANLRPPGLKNVGIQQNLNGQIPGDLVFRDEAGKTVHLSDYFGQKPMILSLVYYRCPMLCGEVLAGLSSALKVLKFNVGDEFNVLTVSFDPKDTPDIGAAKKAEYIERYGRPSAAKGWHFLTGPQSS
ncbi:MAG: SCO family protein, partial [Terriglobales bacterium]